jgi:hypothetical protein
MTELEQKFGVDEAAFLVREIDAWIDANGGPDEFDCADNFRLCRVGDSVGEAEYEETRNDGCCGSVDIEIGPSPAGHVYHHGFNYGH